MRLTQRLLPLLAATLILAGCPSQTISPLAPSIKQTDKIGSQLKDSSKSIGDKAKTVKSETKAARDAVPPTNPLALTLYPHFDAINFNADGIIFETGKLDSLQADVTTLSNDLKATDKQHIQETQALQGQIKSLTTRLDSQSKEDRERLAKIETGMLLLIGVCVVLGFLLHDWTYSIAGIAGCASVLVGCLVLGQVMLWLPKIIGGLIAALVIWLCVDWYRHGNLWGALHTAWQKTTDVAALVQFEQQ